MITPDQKRNEWLIERIAGQIGRWRLTVPSLLFLEVAKPFSFIASQGLLLCQPLLGIVDKDTETDAYVGFLSDRANIDRLITRIEQDIARSDKHSLQED